MVMCSANRPGETSNFKLLLEGASDITIRCNGLCRITRTLGILGLQDLRSSLLSYPTSLVARSSALSMSQWPRISQEAHTGLQ